MAVSAAGIDSGGLSRTWAEGFRAPGSFSSVAAQKRPLAAETIQIAIANSMMPKMRMVKT